MERGVGNEDWLKNPGFAHNERLMEMDRYEKERFDHGYTNTGHEQNGWNEEITSEYDDPHWENNFCSTGRRPDMSTLVPSSSVLTASNGLATVGDTPSSVISNQFYDLVRKRIDEKEDLMKTQGIDQMSFEQLMEIGREKRQRISQCYTELDQNIKKNDESYSIDILPCLDNTTEMQSDIITEDSSNPLLTSNGTSFSSVSNQFYDLVRKRINEKEDWKKTQGIAQMSFEQLMELGREKREQTLYTYNNTEADQNIPVSVDEEQSKESLLAEIAELHNEFAIRDAEHKKELKKSMTIIALKNKEIKVLKKENEQLRANFADAGPNNKGEIVNGTAAGSSSGSIPNQFFDMVMSRLGDVKIEPTSTSDSVVYWDNEHYGRENEGDSGDAW